MFKELKIGVKQKLTGPYDVGIRVLAGWRRSAYWTGPVAPKPWDCLYLSTVNFCNAQCVFCGQWRFKRPKTIISWELFKKAVDQSRELGVRKIDFTPPLGDPLLDPDLENRLQYCTSHAGMDEIHMTTNGIKLAVGKIAEIVGRYVDLVRISIGGFDEESYRAAYGVNSYGKVIQGIFNLLDTPYKRIHLFLRTPVKPKVILQNITFRQIIAHPRVSYEFTNYYDNWGGSVLESDMVGEMKMRKPAPKVGVPCIALNQFWVEPQGNVRLCGCRFNMKESDELVIGNLRTENLRDILAIERWRGIAKKFLGENSPDVCKECTLYRPIIG